MESVAEVVDELEARDPAARDGWMVADAWSGKWVLRYTSSKTLHRNEGVTGYAYSRPSVETPELLLSIDVPRRGWVQLEEPIVRPDAQAAIAGDSAIAECLWQAGLQDTLKLEPRTIKADGREWTPRDPNAGDEVDMDAEKAIRILAATRPVFLDDELLLLRSAVLSDTVFVWTRPGAADPPQVELSTPETETSGLPPSIAAAIRAREKKGSVARRPGNRDIIQKYN